MAVNVRVEIEYKGKKAQGVALANSGYEAQGAEILAPMGFLKSRLDVSAKGKKEKYMAAGGKEVEFVVLGGAVVRVVAQDRTSAPVRALLIVSDLENRIIMNDVLVGELGMNLLDVKKGVWRFADDPAGRERPSEMKELY